MSLSEKLIPIKKKFSLTNEAIIKMGTFIEQLRKHDIITSSLFARKVGVSIKQSDSILPELVNIGILDFFIIAVCKNPDNADFYEAEHYKLFYSLNDVNKFSIQKPCPLCDCGYSYDFSNLKVGFRLKR